MKGIFRVAVLLLILLGVSPALFAQLSDVSPNNDGYFVAIPLPNADICLNCGEEPTHQVGTAHRVVFPFQMGKKRIDETDSVNYFPLSLSFRRE